MTVSFSPRILAAALLTAVLSLAAAAQTPTPNTTEWDSDSLNLRLFYPSDLDQSDAAQVMRDGHFTLFGISGVADPKLAEATHCLRPILLLQLPQSPSKLNAKVEPGFGGGTHVTITPTTTATMLLAELDVNCLSEQQSKSTNLLADMAEIVTKVPGMKPIAQPSWYTIGYQKVHMAAAQGQPQPEPPSSSTPWASPPTGTAISSSGTFPPTASTPSTASPRPPSASAAPSPSPSTP
jgi:hypothetical protein